jgi:hypothetical protein
LKPSRAVRKRRGPRAIAELGKGTPDCAAETRTLPLAAKLISRTPASQLSRWLPRGAHPSCCPIAQLALGPECPSSPHMHRAVGASTRPAHTPSNFLNLSMGVRKQKKRLGSSRWNAGAARSLGWQEVLNPSEQRLTTFSTLNQGPRGKGQRRRKHNPHALRYLEY